MKKRKEICVSPNKTNWKRERVRVLEGGEKNTGSVVGETHLIPGV